MPGPSVEYGSHITRLCGRFSGKLMNLNESQRRNEVDARSITYNIPGNLVSFISKLVPAIC